MSRREQQCHVGLGWLRRQAEHTCDRLAFRQLIPSSQPTRRCSISAPIMSPISFPRRRQKGSSSDGVGAYNFAVPSSGFHSAWAAHSGAVTSISWIQSPPSLLSSSADGLAKIWKPDGSAMLGQASLRFAFLLNDICARPVPCVLYRGSHRYGSNNQTWHVTPGPCQERLDTFI